VYAPQFSIIVPTFNVAESLRACLDSVINQTCKDFELIVVDGGSTDMTVEIVNSYASTLRDRLVMHSGPDEGPYDAMNHGVTMASGAWVLFLGADDTLYAPDTLSQVASFICKNEVCDLAYGDALMRSNSVRYAGEFDLDRLLFQQNICHQAIFYRRGLFAGIGPYNLKYRLWADWDFNIRCFSNPALVARYMNIIVANYNDMSGLSVKLDSEFKKRLPKYLTASAIELMRRRLAAGRK